ncbi:MAG: hypothetical protein MI861_09155 [Pirellulales bacterium]|nr:hypothetical protein [Pirellulales bacterium]
MGLLSQAGCVALNIPSQRLHDAGDKGGLFGHWRDRSVGTHFHQQVHHPAETLVIQPNLDGGPLEVAPFECDPVQGGNGKPAEVPWPKFHPVPTRPVFGSPAQIVPAG